MAGFKAHSEYQLKEKTSYSLLPFNFHKLNSKKYRAVTIGGEYAEFDKKSLDALVNKTLPKDSSLYINLRSKGFLFDSLTKSNIDLSAIKLRTKMAHVFELTSLHIMVISLRCEHSCPYCQVSRQNLDSNKKMFDMSQEIADKAIDVIFQSPSKNIKIEFKTYL